jgi:hypothetical protein
MSCAVAGAFYVAFQKMPTMMAFLLTDGRYSFTRLGPFDAV